MQNANRLRPLVVIPTLNEIEHIEALAHRMLAAVLPFDGTVVVADGGSTDGTREVVDALPGVHLLDNPARLQGAGINRAVEVYGEGHAYLIRVDAHAAYPLDFIPTLLAEADRIGSASVVVSMVAKGDKPLQTISANAQNARIGNGGSGHRTGAGGRFVDHGHHALMRLDAFREVGGYDPTFSHNEDAELDTRLSQAGYSIWLTERTQITYFPRSTLAGLARQYMNYGRGRARNILKHRTRPRLRQCVVTGVAPALALGLASPLFPIFALPALLWAGVCLAAGLVLSWRGRRPLLALTGPVSMLMHAAWSVGFWVQVISQRARHAA